jgi:hypothetical protein
VATAIDINAHIREVCDIALIGQLLGHRLYGRDYQQRQQTGKNIQK